MDFKSYVRKIAPVVTDQSESKLCPFDISFYKVPPVSTITYDEFQEIALDRLKLYRVLEDASAKGHKLYSEEWKECIKQDLTKQGMKKYVRLTDGCTGEKEADFEARRVDYISHFIAKVAYCRSEELRRFFLNREIEWFRVRYMNFKSQMIKNFLKENNLLYTPITDEEKDNLREDLLSSTAGNWILDKTDFYRVPFTEVCSLVKNRRILVRQGLAYVPSFELIVCILSKFRADLSQSLVWYNSRLHLLDDDRIEPLLANLHTVHTGNNYVVRESGENIDPANIDAYSKKHFPLCMKQMHDVLRAEHHHKHQTRLTYGLFLKGIGLLYEDAVRFWREEFTKKMDVNKFERDYLYNIKHQYGKVGRMLNYSPYSCMKIIMASVGPGECHGCPFKNLDPLVIKQKMSEAGLGPEHSNEIKDLVVNKHFQLACGKYFEFSKGKPPTNGINHPNQYFEESVNLEKANAANK